MNKKNLLKIVKKSVQASFINGVVDEKKVAFFVKSFKALPLVDSIIALKNFATGVRAELEKTTLFVTSAQELSQSDLGVIKKSLQKTYPIREVVSQIDPSLLGGVKFKISDTLIDLSVKSKLEQLKGAIKG